MKQNTTYQYKANNASSYDVLVHYAADLNVNVQLFPAMLTINIDGSAADGIGKFIDDKGLDFHIAPIEVHDENLGEVIDNETIDPDTLRGIIRRMIEHKREMAKQEGETLAKVIKERDDALTDKEMYHRWYTDTLDSYGRVKNQVKAIANLMNEVFK